MDRRTFCCGMALLVPAALLVACGEAATTAPAMPKDLPGRLAGQDTGALAGRLVAASWAADTPAGCANTITVREKDPTGATAVTSYFNPGYHRVTYAVFPSAEAARAAYARAAQALRDNPRGRAVDNGDPTAPATALFYDDGGSAAMQAGPVLIRLIASGSNRDLFGAFVRASVAHLGRVAG